MVNITVDISGESGTLDATGDFKVDWWIDRFGEVVFDAERLPEWFDEFDAAAAVRREIAKSGHDIDLTGDGRA